MKTTYLFPALLGACFVLFGSSVSLQAQDGPTPPDSTDAPIDPVDGQPPQGPNNPPQPPPEICGIETDKIECKWPYNFPNTVLGNLKCQLRGKCELNDMNGKQECKDNNIEDVFPLEEYVGTTTLIKDIKQIVDAPNAPRRKLFDKIEKTCYEIYDCETECVMQGSIQCKRKEKPRVKETYFEYKWKGPCP